MRVEGSWRGGQGGSEREEKMCREEEQSKGRSRGKERWRDGCVKGNRREGEREKDRVMTAKPS